jgi:hypothetical protein
MAEQKQRRAEEIKKLFSLTIVQAGAAGRISGP